MVEISHEIKLMEVGVIRSSSVYVFELICHDRMTGKLQEYVEAVCRYAKFLAASLAQRTRSNSVEVIIGGYY